MESYVSSNGPLQCKRCQRFGHTQRNCGYAPRCVAYGGSHVSGGCSTPRKQPQCCGCGDNHTLSYRGCTKWKEAKAVLANRAPEGVRKSAATIHAAAPKAQRARPSAEQTNLGEGWNHFLRGGVLSRPPPNPKPSPQLVTVAPSQPNVTATRKTSGPKKQPLSRPLGRRRKQRRVSKPRPPNPQPLTWLYPPNLPPPHSRKSLISSNSPSKHVWS